MFRRSAGPVEIVSGRRPVNRQFIPTIHIARSIAAGTKTVIEPTSAGGPAESLSSRHDQRPCEFSACAGRATATVPWAEIPCAANHNCLDLAIVSAPTIGHIAFEFEVHAGPHKKQKAPHEVYSLLRLLSLALLRPDLRPSSFRGSNNVRATRSR
jgi:hypothetical protein